MHECSEGSCSSKSSQNGCGCQNKQCGCSCHSQKCGCGCGKGEGQKEKFEYFLELADCAWKEVLKDELKKQIQANQKNRMPALAKIIAEANSARWKRKMEKRESCSEFKDKLCNFFSQEK